MGMGTLFFIIGALLKSFPPPANAKNPPPASKAMAAMLYIYVCFYSLGIGPVPVRIFVLVFAVELWILTSSIVDLRRRYLPDAHSALRIVCR